MKTLSFGMLMTEQVYAPGFNGRAKFLFFADHCMAKKNGVQEVEKLLGPILIGKYGVIQYTARADSLLWPILIGKHGIIAYNIKLG